MERQYIGARYVPLFYDGPEGNNWQAGVAYDPLTIVTYLNTSYTSKKPVPAAVGNPQANPDYWVATGNYNAQVEEYRHITENLLNKYNTKITWFNTIADAKAATLSDGIVITEGYHFAGDSGGGTYIVSTNSFSPVVEQAGTMFLNLVINNSKIYPETCGAYGDGIHDDTNAMLQAIQTASQFRLTVSLQQKTYITSQPLPISSQLRIEGVSFSNEYSQSPTIKNVVTNLLSINEIAIGVYIGNIRFEGSTAANNYLIKSNTQNILRWTIFENVAAVNFNSVFNLSILGCRFYNMWINGGNSVGVLSGTDNVFNEWFVACTNQTPLTSVMLELNMSLSRFENIYFTGMGLDFTNGCKNILKINSFSNNLNFVGVYFDYSYESAIVLTGSGSNFPISGCFGITFEGCLFRANWINQTSAGPIIDMSYSRGISFISCTFDTVQNPIVNSNATINAGQFCQAITLIGNAYVSKPTFSGTTANSIVICDGFPNVQQNIGIGNQGFKNLYINDFSVTTDSQYGSANIPLPSYVTPNQAFVSINNGTRYIAINSLNPLQIIIRKVDGSPAINETYTVNVMVTFD